MAETRRDPRDETVQRYQNSDGLHIWWRDHSTGETYGGVLRDQAATDALISEGLNLDDFWPQINRP
ncbi:hypothetical protein MHK74_14315 [Microbacterium aurum]|uniref:hypothetical protein n=1 Tax=Microbacterium aurum TaxID=36805 RepID=UPI001EF71EA2|nr:hypothetical protein [Microbacterium aurum]MCG7415714.1 hypothetical protein [Microbacterium aurum]